MLIYKITTVLSHFFQYVTSGINDFLQSLNKTQSEVTDNVKKLTAAQDDFKLAADAFYNSTQRQNLNIILEPEYLAGILVHMTSHGLLLSAL